MNENLRSLKFQAPWSKNFSFFSYLHTDIPAKKSQTGCRISVNRAMSTFIGPVIGLSSKALLYLVQNM